MIILEEAAVTFFTLIQRLFGFLSPRNISDNSYYIFFIIQNQEGKIYFTGDFAVSAIKCPIEKLGFPFHYFIYDGGAFLPGVGTVRLEFGRKVKKRFGNYVLPPGLKDFFRFCVAVEDLFIFNYQDGIIRFLIQRFKLFSRFIQFQ
jgi:hypothetical protein